MTVTALTAADVALTKVEEEFVAYRYWDPYGDCWTIGYGTTSGAGVIEPIPEYCTEAEATDWLLDYMNRDVVPAILRVFQPANGNELGGLADLGYNCGSGVFGEEPMYSALRSRNLAAIGDAFMAFDHDANGGVLADLERRRAADRALFLRSAPAPPPPPKPKPSYFYDRYPKGAVRTAAERYDALRRLKKPTATDRANLKVRELQCRKYAKGVARKANAQRLKNGKPSWSVNHRGFLFQQLHARGQGKLVEPTA